MKRLSITYTSDFGESRTWKDATPTAADIVPGMQIDAGYASMHPGKLAYYVSGTFVISDGKDMVEVNHPEMLIPDRLLSDDGAGWDDKFEADFTASVIAQIQDATKQLAPVLPARIRKAREAAGLTQTEAAKKAGCTQQVWAQYEGGLVDPTATRLTAIAKALGVSPGSLLD